MEIGLELNAIFPLPWKIDYGRASWKTVQAHKAEGRCPCLGKAAQGVGPRDLGGCSVGSGLLLAPDLTVHVGKPWVDLRLTFNLGPRHTVRPHY